MSNYFHPRSMFFCIAIAGLQGRAPIVFAQTICAKTPAAAIRSDGTESAQMPGSKGYRVTGMHWDPVLRQRWATIARCDHPEWPAFSLRASERKIALRGPAAAVREEHAPAVSDTPMVRAGDIVHLWRQEDLLRIEVTGVAEESGSLGKSIRVRLLRRNTDDQSIEEQFTGVIRGPRNVEMQR